MSLYFYEDFFLGIKSLALIRERVKKKRRKSLSSYLSNLDYSLYLIQWYLDYKSSRKLVMCSLFSYVTLHLSFHMKTVRSGET